MRSKSNPAVANPAVGPERVLGCWLIPMPTPAYGVIGNDGRRVARYVPRLNGSTADGPSPLQLASDDVTTVNGEGRAAEAVAARRRRNNGLAGGHVACQSILLSSGRVRDA